jgi:hypothetical protein
MSDVGTLWIDEDGSASATPSYKPAYIWSGSGWNPLGNQPTVELFNSYALLSPSASVNQTIINTNITGGTVNATTLQQGGIQAATTTGTQTLTNKTLTSPSINYAILTSPEEKLTVSATAATGTINFDVLTQGILYYTSNSSANFTLNFRGSSSSTLNSILNTAQSVTVSFLNTNGSTARYPTAFQVDGSAVTPKWSGGSAPTSGNSNSVDAYSFTIVKTANATFTVFAGAVQFA